MVTASDEKVFSVISVIKIDLRSKMGDEWINDLRICYNEEIVRNVDNEKIKKTISRDEKTSYVFRSKKISYVVAQ